MWGRGKFRGAHHHAIPWVSRARICQLSHYLSETCVIFCIMPRDCSCVGGRNREKSIHSFFPGQEVWSGVIIFWMLLRLIVFSIISCTHLPSIHGVWWSIYRNILVIFLLCFIVFWEFFTYPGGKPFIRCMICTCFFTSLWLFSSKSRHYLDELHFIKFFFYGLCSWYFV